MDILERITDLEHRHADTHLLNLGQFREHMPLEAWAYGALRELVAQDAENGELLAAHLDGLGL